MRAKVKASSPLKSITACAGIAFFKHSWTEVPVEREEEARANPYLEIEERPESIETSAPARPRRSKK